MADPGEESFQGTDRFQLRRRLGAGAFGVVYEAFDRERESVVALKTLRRASSDEALYRLKREFRSLADIAHPNLVTLYEMLSDGRQWFFTMELVDGTDFLDYVRRSSPSRSATGASGANCESQGGSEEDTASLSPDDAVAEVAAGPGVASRARLWLPDLGRLRPALRQAAAGIRALHRAGKLHRDIKSSNVLVTSEGRVVLLDFGLVTEVDDPDLDESIAVAGTPAYMSPEQGAGQPLSEASDWYSLGVMLYEALTGQGPFTGRPAEMMREKQVREPRAPRELAQDAPKDLDRLCSELLRRRPEDRPGGSEILLRLGVDLSEPSSLASVISSDARAAPFVGRRPEIELLWKAFRDAEQGRAVTVAIHGGSGMGKTALVRQFLEALRSRHQVVIAHRPLLRAGVRAVQGVGQSDGLALPLLEAASFRTGRSLDSPGCLGACAALSRAAPRGGRGRSASASARDPRCPGAAAPRLRSAAGADGAPHGGASSRPLHR